MSVRPIETVPKTFELVRQSAIRRVRAFFDSGEGRFENLLWIVWPDKQEELHSS